MVSQVELKGGGLDTPSVKTFEHTSIGLRYSDIECERVTGNANEESRRRGWSLDRRFAIIGLQ